MTAKASAREALDVFTTTGASVLSPICLCIPPVELALDALATAEPPLLATSPLEEAIEEGGWEGLDLVLAASNGDGVAVCFLFENLQNAGGVAPGNSFA